mgnify:CR=1 FL=1
MRKGKSILKTKLKVLDLFSGIGGFSLGLHSTDIFDTVKFVEFDEFCQKILKKNFPNVPIEGDIKNVKGKEFEADIIVGGFPCQPFSVAGKQKGRDDNRYLWPEMFRLIKEIKPEFVIGENVQGLVNLQNGMVLRQVQDDLVGQGFEVQCFLVPASGIGAWHQRSRVWIVGHSKHNGLLATEKRSRNQEVNGRTQEGQNETIELERTSGSRNNEDVSNTERQRLEGLSEQGTTLSRENERAQFGSTNSSRSSEDVSNTESIGTRGCRDTDQEEGRESCSSTQSDGTHANVSNTISTGSRRKDSRNINEQGRVTTKTKRESIQSKDGKACSNDIESNSPNVSNTIGKLQDGCSSTTRDSEAELIRLECNEGWHWNKVRSEAERCSEQDLQHPDNQRCKEPNVSEEPNEPNITDRKHDQGRDTKTWWQIESDLCGVPNGISRELDKNRANRIKSLGNAIVPQMARIFGLAIKKVLNEK